MAVTYCTAANVADFLRITISTTTSPTTAQVESLINMKEEEIDRRTGHTFGRIKTVSKELHDLPLLYTFGRGTFITLKHREIRTDANGAFEAAQGDKLEIFDGGSATYTDITTSTGQYQTIPERGEIYLRGFVFTIMRDSRVRVTYRYGSTTVPEDIKQACIKMVAIDLLRASFRLDQLPMGDNKGVNLQETTARWQDDVDRLLRNREEVLFIP